MDPTAEFAIGGGSSTTISGANFLDIDQNGNVGIGTIAPFSRLDVSGLTTFGGTNLSGNVPIQLENTKKLLIGWNETNQAGETDFIANWHGGNQGGFRFYNYSDTGTATNLLTILGNGNVGIGNLGNNYGAATNPSYNLDINPTGTSAVARIVPQTWSVATPSTAEWIMGDTNHTITTTWGSGTQINDTNGIFLTGNNVGIGQTTAAHALDIKGLGGQNPDLNVNGRIVTGDSGHVGGVWVDGGTNEFVGEYNTSTIGLYNKGWNFQMDQSGDVTIGTVSPGTLTVTINGNLSVTGTILSQNSIASCGQAFTACSDRRLKKNIRPLANTLSKLDQLRGVSFEWNHLATTVGLKEGDKNIGMIAQELQKVYPELVKADKGKNHEYLSIDYSKFTAVLLESIKELKGQVNTMQDQINFLQAEVKALEKQK